MTYLYPSYGRFRARSVRAAVKPVDGRVTGRVHPFLLVVCTAASVIWSQQALTLSALLPHPQEIQVLQIPALNSRDVVACLADTTWIFEFEFVLYDSSPQLTNTGFLIGDIVVRILMAIHPLNTPRPPSSSQPPPLLHRRPPALSAPPSSRVDEKEGVSSRFWREERDGRGDGRDERDGRERRDNPSSSLSSPPFAMMCRLRPEAGSRAKPGQKKPGQAKPRTCLQSWNSHCVECWSSVGEILELKACENTAKSRGLSQSQAGPSQSLRSRSGLSFDQAGADLGQAKAVKAGPAHHYASRSGVTWDDVDVEFTVFTNFALEFEFDYHSKLGLRDPSENSRPGRGALTYET
ncbi:hypothetical protein C8J56DRAFT_903715 [Mycena floridula]|nr:hypothetical protein C8J56DRAFT_903715 [Mycena floridula]